MFSAILLFSCISASISQAAPKVRWPSDVVEWAKLKDAAETAKKQKKGFAFIFVPAAYGEDTDGGVARSIAATNDAIRALKSFCLIVKGDMQAVLKAMRTQQEDPNVSKALMEGLNKAGNTYPLVVVLDGKRKSLLGAVAGQKIHDEGKKVFREAKKKFRNLDEEEEDKKK